jgi:Fe2+ or Zn2+ uptake regulation protein
VAGSDVDAVLAQIRAHGGRITTARRLVVATLLDASTHLSAEDLTDAIRHDHPEVHLTTVYRTLESLETMGIVAHTHLGHGAAVYHLGELHQHLACEECGRLIDVPTSVLDELTATLQRDHGFVLHVGHFALLGRCADHGEEDAAADPVTSAASIER